MTFITVCVTSTVTSHVLRVMPFHEDMSGNITVTVPQHFNFSSFILYCDLIKLVCSEPIRRFIRSQNAKKKRKSKNKRWLMCNIVHKEHQDTSFQFLYIRFPM